MGSEPGARDWFRTSSSNPDIDPICIRLSTPTSRNGLEREQRFAWSTPSIAWRADGHPHEVGDDVAGFGHFLSLSLEETAVTNRRGWTVGLFLSVGTLGAMLQLRGALLASFGETYAVTEGQLGLVATAASVGTLVTVVAVGMSISRLDVKRVLTVAAVILAGLLVVIGSSPTYATLLVGFVAAGLARGALHALDRPLLGHLYSSERGRIYNLQDMAWATGASLGPLLATAAIAVGEWRLAYYALGAALLPVAVIFWRLESPDLEDEEAMAIADLRALLRMPAIGTMGGLMLLLSLVESGMFTWLPYYAGQSLPRGVANLSLSIYLASYIPGRYVYSVASERIDNLRLVLGSGVLAMGALVAFVLVDGYAMLVVVAVVGFLVAGLFPTLLAWATNTVPEYSGPVNALAFVASGVGFMLFPAGMGVVAEAYSLELAMGLLAVAMGLFALLAGGILVAGRDGV